MKKNQFVKLISSVISIVCFYGYAFSESVSEDFVKVEGAAVKGKIEGSNIFMENWSNVKIDDLYVCTHEVTQKEYETYCTYGDKKSPADTDGKGDNFPAYYINWYDTIVYCNLRSIDENLKPVYSLKNETDPKKWKGIVSSGEKYCGPSGLKAMSWNAIKYDKTANGYRLPTEAEWEFIAREMSVKSKYYIYSGSDFIDDVAWYHENSLSTDEIEDEKPAVQNKIFSIAPAHVKSIQPRVQPVKMKQPNALGIFDMSGNVAEWCWDFHGQELRIKLEPALRGGSAFSSKEHCNVLTRSGSTAYIRDKHNGFRVVRSCVN